MSSVSASEVSKKSRIIDWILIGLLTTVAFLLGCYEMADSDIWWHLSGGRWILSHHRVPELDPFTFGSQDRKWVDIHWGFQVLMSGMYAVGGVPGLILIAAIVGGLTLLVAATSRRPDWPIAVTVLCWIPALILMSWRFDPRPEIFTLFYIACFLAVLGRAETRPRLMWFLPVIQVLWVNTQGLFVFGPILVAFYLIGQGAQDVRERWRRGSFPARQAWWIQIGAASLAVAGACFLNPYLLDGVRFPLELLPKATQPGNVYKEYIDELASPRKLLQESGAALDANWYPRILYLLLIALPVSFLLPAIWRAWRGAPRADRRGRRANPSAGPRPLTGAWLAILGGITGLLIASTLCFSRSQTSGWAGAIGQGVPFAIFVVSLLLAVPLSRRSWSSCALALVGAAALAIWIVWLRAELLSREPGGANALAPPLAVAGILLAALVFFSGGSLFRILLAVAFGYLSLQALQNASRFALVAGLILTWNFGEWTRDLLAARQYADTKQPSHWWARSALAAVLIIWIVTLLTDQFHGWTGEPRHFLFREQPFEFAHDAIRFAGQDGQPDRALVYDLGQTGLFDFYHAPLHKPFMDGRLEMPDQKTFQTYIDVERWLQESNPRWEAALHEMGDPLILLTHQQNYKGEARLLTHPGWRCVYFDALASVFLPRMRSDLERSYPTIDFAARHFSPTKTPSTPDISGAAFREMRALYNLATELRRNPSATETWRIPALLVALDRGSLAQPEEPARSSVWTLLGNCYWSLIPDLAKPPPTPADQWDPAAGLPWAQATYCYRRALDLAPEDPTALRYLSDALRARRMTDIESNDRGTVITWAIAERLGPLYLHLGRPSDARRVWQSAGDAPAGAGRLCREAATYWVEREFDRAIDLYRQARAMDPHSSEAWWGLAMLSAQLGRAGDTVDACRGGLRLPLSDRQRADLLRMQALAVGNR
jgi:tetratricopeptide (TPR) repeat protein